MATRLLVVDDDTELTRLLTELLSQEGFDIDTLSSGHDAAERAGYALVILDVRLPDGDGFQVLKTLRRTSRVPVILLTARGADIDRIVGLEIGATRQPLSVDDVLLDPAARTVRRGDASVGLTTVEFDILRALLEDAGHIVAREAIAEKGLGRRFDPFDRSVDMHISKLRRKLGPRQGGDERIKTIRGVGYIYTRPPIGG